MVNYVGKLQNNIMSVIICDRRKREVYEKVEFFTSLIAPNGNLFKDSFCITETPELLTEVRLFLQQLITNDINREEVSE